MTYSGLKTNEVQLASSDSGWMGRGILRSKALCNDLSRSRLPPKIVWYILISRRIWRWIADTILIPPVQKISLHSWLQIFADVEMSFWKQGFFAIYFTYFECLTYFIKMKKVVVMEMNLLNCNAYISQGC